LHQGIEQFRSTGTTSSRRNVAVEIVWKPYQIDPNTHVDGELFDDYCQRRWGGSSWTNHLRQEGKKEGCHFANWRYICNTLRAHQLILYGTTYHPATTTTDAMNAALFEALYEKGWNISRVDTLVTIGSDLFTRGGGATHSFDAEHLRTYLQEQQGRPAVELEMQQLQRTSYHRVRGVPLFLVGIVTTTTSGTTDGNWTRPPISLSGAQPASVLAEAFHELSLEL
jgi:predicted DsbA family dithiol-disulfide isomerase